MGKIKKWELTEEHLEAWLRFTYLSEPMRLPEKELMHLIHKFIKVLKYFKASSYTPRLAYHIEPFIQVWRSLVPEQQQRFRDSLGKLWLDREELIQSCIDKQDFYEEGGVDIKSRLRPEVYAWSFYNVDFGNIVHPSKEVVRALLEKLKTEVEKCEKIMKDSVAMMDGKTTLV